MKTCAKCKKTKPRVDFYKDYSGNRDGLDSYCKVCHNASCKASRARSGDRARVSSTEASRRWRLRNPETNRERARIQARKYRGSHKVKARRKLYWEIQTGRMIRPEACERCHEKKRITGHHDDYSKPLEVTWLCYQCHADVDRETRRKLKETP